MALSFVYYRPWRNPFSSLSLTDYWYFAVLARLRFHLSSSASLGGTVEGGGMEASSSARNRRKTEVGRDRRASGDLMGKPFSKGEGAHTAL